MSQSPNLANNIALLQSAVDKALEAHSELLGVNQILCNDGSVEIQINTGFSRNAESVGLSADTAWEDLPLDHTIWFSFFASENGFQFSMEVTFDRPNGENPVDVQLDLTSETLTEDFSSQAESLQIEDKVIKDGIEKLQFLKSTLAPVFESLPMSLVRYPSESSL